MKKTGIPFNWHTKSSESDSDVDDFVLIVKDGDDLRVDAVLPDNKLESSSRVSGSTHSTVSGKYV